MILEKQHIDFEQIYLSYFSKMKRFAREYVLSDEDAENIVQDVFLDFWEKKELLPLPINILAYLFTSIKNRCIDFLRHKIVQKEVENKMQEEYRLTLQMKYYSDYPFMHLLYSQLLVCQRVCLQNTVCLICK